MINLNRSQECVVRGEFFLLPLLVVWWLAVSTWRGFFGLQNRKKDLLMLESIAEFKNEWEKAVKCIHMHMGENFWVSNLQNNIALKQAQSSMTERTWHYFRYACWVQHNMMNNLSLIELLLLCSCSTHEQSVIPSVIFAWVDLSLMVWKKLMLL